MPPLINSAKENIYIHTRLHQHTDSASACFVDDYITIIRKLMMSLKVIVLLALITIKLALNTCRRMITMLKGHIDLSESYTINFMSHKC